MGNLSYTIRPGTVDDLAPIVPMWVELYRVEKQSGMAYALRDDAAKVWEDEARRRIGTPNFLLFVAEAENATVDVLGSQDHRIAGFVVAQIRRRPSIYKDPLVGSLTELFVHPSHRGHKLASRLIAAAMDAFRNRGLPYADALPVAGNAPSLALWQSLGWKLDLVQYRFDLTEGGHE